MKCGLLLVTWTDWVLKQDIGFETQTFESEPFRDSKGPACSRIKDQKNLVILKRKLLILLRTLNFIYECTKQCKDV